MSGVQDSQKYKKNPFPAEDSFVVFTTRVVWVLVVGGKDFSLLGQPMLSRDQVYVEATVIEKTLSHNQIWATYKRRKRFRKLKLFRTPQTMIVINRIELNTIQEHGES